MRLLFDLLLTALALLLVAEFLPGVEVVSFLGAIIFAAVLGLINLIIRPVLKILTLPITIITFGLFSLVLNALLLWLATALVDGVMVAGFWSAFIAALVVSLITSIGHAFTDED